MTGAAGQPGKNEGDGTGLVGCDGTGLVGCRPARVSLDAAHIYDVAPSRWP